MTDADMTRTMSQSGSGSFRTRKSMEDMTPEEKTQADTVDLRCLTISIAVLERVNGVSYVLSVQLRILEIG